MENKSVTKNILSSVQFTVKATKEKVLDENLIGEITPNVLPIADFYRISAFEAIVLSFFLEYGFRGIDIDTEKLIEHFGKEMSVMAEINQALKQLSEKKLIYFTGRKTNGRRRSSKSIKLNPLALEAMLSGDETTLTCKTSNSFFDFLDEVSELIKLRIEEAISTEVLVDDVRSLMESNRRFPEIKWLLKQKYLNNYDLTLLLDVCIEQANGEEDVDFDNNLREVFEDLQTRIKYKKSVKNNKCPLFTNGLLEFSFNDFTSFSYVTLAPEALDVLLGGYQDAVKNNFKPRMGTLIHSTKINDEKLFYNPAEEEQIDTLMTAFSADNYNHLLTSLVDNQMKPGFTVLLHGHPGTGKTSSVKQIAKATGRTIFMVEIEKVHSKWVGDSEKNLSKIFEEYKKCRKTLDRDPILLFNESDALINKRINARSSTDKMSNALQNILLQELEDFEGIFMATTNLAEQLDSAFDRRLLYKIEFKPPQKAVSFKILCSVFPEVDESVLRQINNEFSLTGGQIANIKKKLLVKKLLSKDLNEHNYLLQLCRDEFSLSNRVKPHPIGFYLSKN